MARIMFHNTEHVPQPTAPTRCYRSGETEDEAKLPAQWLANAINRGSCTRLEEVPTTTEGDGTDGTGEPNGEGQGELNPDDNQEGSTEGNAEGSDEPPADDKPTKGRKGRKGQG